MFPNEVYARCLLPQGNGYPLWDPKPYDNLCTEYREKGVGIGDVGIITSDGTFDFLFNIMLPADHQINRGRTPGDFEQVILDPPEDISVREGWHWEGSHVASVSIKKKRIEGDISSSETRNPYVVHEPYSVMTLSSY